VKTINKYKALKVRGKRIDEHRLIMQNVLGRKLSRNEVVHHIDGNKSNNSLENLVVMTRSEHSSMHQKGKKNSKETREKLSEAHKNKPMFARRLFSNEEIDYIRKNYKPQSSEFGARSLSRKFGVAHSTIRKIVNRETYVI
jgi:hypothetical protein